MLKGKSSTNKDLLYKLVMFVCSACNYKIKTLSSCHLELQHLGDMTISMSSLLQAHHPVVKNLSLISNLTLPITAPCRSFGFYSSHERYQSCPSAPPPDEALYHSKVSPLSPLLWVEQKPKGPKGLLLICLPLCTLHHLCSPLLGSFQ